MSLNSQRSNIIILIWNIISGVIYMNENNTPNGWNNNNSQWNTSFAPPQGQQYGAQPDPNAQNPQYGYQPDPNAQNPQYGAPYGQDYNNTGAAPPPQEPQYSPPYGGDPGYNYYSPQPPEKKSKAGLILGIIAALLLIGIGVFAFLFIKNSKSDSSSSKATSSAVSSSRKHNSSSSSKNNSKKNSSASEDEEEEDEEKTTSDSEEEPSTTAATTAAESATTTTTTTKPPKEVIPAEKIDAAKNAAITYFKGTEKHVGEPAYELHDVNGDTTPELFIIFYTEASSSNLLYTYNGSAYVKQNADLFGSLSYCVDSHYIRRHAQEGADVYTYYELDENNKLTKIDELNASASSPKEYYRNGSKISEAEYTAACSFYNSMSWADITAKPKYPENNNNNNNNNSNNNNNNNKDSKNAYTDMSNVIAMGKVVTQSTSLNLRESASTNATVIAQIPKGSYVAIISDNGSWFYVKYYKDTSSPIYYGYVSKEYVSITERYRDGENLVDKSIITQSPTIYPCEEYGTLNTHGGTLPGVSTTYVTGGSLSYVRKSLGHGWHVKVVRYCYNMNICWCEIYDSQGGDYYGWVDSTFIDFY